MWEDHYEEIGDGSGGFTVEKRDSWGMTEKGWEEQAEMMQEFLEYGEDGP